MQFNLNPKTVFRYLISLIAVLVSVHLFLQINAYFMGWGNLYALTNILNLYSEIGIPAWFSQSLLLIVACLAFLIANHAQKHHDAYAWQWYFIGGFFLFLSADESAMIHEQITVSLVHNTELNKLAATTLYSGILLVLGIACTMKLYLSLPRKTQFLLMVAAVIFVIGAFVIDNAGDTFINTEFMRIIVPSLDELMELVGVAVFIYALLEYMEQRNFKLTTTVSSKV